MEQLITNPLFQALFNSPVPRIIVLADAPFFTILTSNDAHKTVTNLVGRDISGKSIWEIFDPNESGGNGGVLLNEALTQAQVTGKTVLMPPFRYDMGAPEGVGMVEKWWQLEIMPVGGDAVAPKYLLVTTNDITDRTIQENKKEHIQRKLEDLVAERTEGLVASEAKYRGLIEQSPIAITLLLGRDLVIDAANPQMLKLWSKYYRQGTEGVSLDHLTGKKLTDVFPDLDSQRIALLNTVFETGTKRQYEVAYPLNAPQGEKENFARIFLNPVFNEAAKVSAIIVSAIDVTEEVIALKELERAYEQVRLSKLAAQLGTFDMDLKAGTMEWDLRCRELFGISHDAAVTYEKDFLIGLHPDDRERVQAVINALFNREKSNGDYDVEYRTIGVQDNRVRWVRAKGKVYFDSENKPVRFIGSVLDITDQKHEEQLRNDFIAMASHELKTPLTSLLACLQILERDAAKSGNEDELLRQAERQVVKMVTMVNGFLNLSRLESGKLNLNITAVQMSSLIEEVVSEATLIHPGVRIYIEDGNDITALIDKEKIEHVLLNLLTNAIKYSNPGKPISIKCSVQGGMVTVSITDEGIGINKRDLDRLFDRYYRVENPDAKYVSGFGIGLYLSREIVQLHHGKLEVESEPGKGSTFSFHLPVSAPSVNP